MALVLLAFDSLCFMLLVMSFCYCSIILMISPSCIVKLAVECGIFVVKSVIFVIFHEIFCELQGHFFHDFITFGVTMLC